MKIILAFRTNSNFMNSMSVFYRLDLAPSLHMISDRLKEKGDLWNDLLEDTYKTDNAKVSAFPVFPGQV